MDNFYTQNQVFDDAVAVIYTAHGMTVFLDSRPFSINKTAKNYEPAVAAIKAKNLQSLRRVVELKTVIAQTYDGNRISLKDGALYYDDEPINHTIISRVVDVFNEGGDILPMLLFMENLLLNSSKCAVDELYGFLEACELPITTDGHFLAYKRVNANYTDCYTGKIDNSIGATPSMPRNKVDEDKNRTCSDGLHFCSYGYLSSYGGERIMILKINPRDVVTIPTDYNNAKGRACLYEVVGEIPVNDYDRMPSKLIDGMVNDDFDWGSDDDFDDAGHDFEDDGEYDFVELAPKVNPSAKLTVNDVRKIRNMLADDWSIAGIARTMNISDRTIRRIRDGEAWKNVI